MTQRQNPAGIDHSPSPRNEYSSHAFFSEGDQRMHVPPSQRFSPYRLSLSERLRRGLSDARNQLGQLDREEIKVKSKALLRQYPWQSAIIGFSVAALLGHRVFRRGQ